MIGFHFNSTADSAYVQAESPSVTYAMVSPSAISQKTTVVLTSRVGVISGRFDIPGKEKGPHNIVLCLSGDVFRRMMIDHAPLGTMIEIIRPDNSVFKYRYRG